MKGLFSLSAEEVRGTCIKLWHQPPVHLEPYLSTHWSNSLNPDQARHFVGHDLGPNCFLISYSTQH